MRIAILDLGTNVFNLLLANFTPDKYEIIKIYKHAAKLGEGGGLMSGILSKGAFDRGESALREIMRVLNECGGADKIYAFATSAIRDAKNGLDFAKQMNQTFGIEIDIIPGDREAELIFKGVKESLSEVVSFEERVLMMDIGGGSNEFIISDSSGILWKKSFPIGMARMRERFNYCEPIQKEVIEEFNNYCSEVTNELWSEVKKYNPKVFVGASGSFDTFKDLIYNCGYKELPAIELPKERLIEIDDLLVKSTREERLEMAGISEVRVDYIVLASIFTRMVLKRVEPEIVYQSSYSLKQGALIEFYEKYLNNR